MSFVPRARNDAAVSSAGAFVATAIVLTVALLSLLDLHRIETAVQEEHTLVTLRESLDGILGMVARGDALRAAFLASSQTDRLVEYQRIVGQMQTDLAAIASRPADRAVVGVDGGLRTAVAAAGAKSSEISRLLETMRRGSADSIEPASWAAADASTSSQLRAAVETMHGHVNVALKAVSIALTPPS